MSRPKGSKNKPKIVLTYGSKKTGKINNTIPQVKKGLKRGYKVEDEVETKDVEKDVEKESIEINPVETNTVETTPTETTSTQINTTLPEPKELKSDTKKSTKTYIRCERCGDEIYCEPRRIDTNLLTGMADFHRATPRYVKLCDKCCRQLNDIVDDWLLKGKCGNDLKKKGWI